MTFQYRTQAVCIAAMVVAAFMYQSNPFYYPLGLFFGIVSASITYTDLGNTVRSYINYSDNLVLNGLALIVMCASIWFAPMFWIFAYPAFILSFSVLAPDFGSWAHQTLTVIMFLAITMGLFFLPQVVSKVISTPANTVVGK